jgi:hypothetical protein
MASDCQFRKYRIAKRVVWPSTRESGHGRGQRRRSDAIIVATRTTTILATLASLRDRDLPRLGTRPVAVIYDVIAQRLLSLPMPSHNFGDVLGLIHAGPDFGEPTPRWKRLLGLRRVH